ncbi:hypothetical protein EVAR_7866_1 [Eumeta japonica]|uniref:Uncharacterized protein n=1 Tax=Eumeta variegata TaxID=151549 RepID=A0A4C1TV08_EUMVA|nr:hypothetical protein EVAR_7866_1 [Eumeta japonica]
MQRCSSSVAAITDLQRAARARPAPYTARLLALHGDGLLCSCTTLPPPSPLPEWRPEGERRPRGRCRRVRLRVKLKQTFCASQGALSHGSQTCSSMAAHDALGHLGGFKVQETFREERSAFEPSIFRFEDVGPRPFGHHRSTYSRSLSIRTGYRGRSLLKPSLEDILRPAELRSHVGRKALGRAVGTPAEADGQADRPPKSIYPERVRQIATLIN